jgi:lipooligosaccharide transport system ATP-binding protein
VAQTLVEVVTLIPIVLTEVRVTQDALELLVLSPPLATRATQLAAEVFTTQGAVTRTTQVALEVLFDRLPGLRLDPAHDVEISGWEPGLRMLVDNLDPDFTVAENLIVYGRYFRIPEQEIKERIPQLLDFAGLSGRADAAIAALSGGMKRRLTIARSLINEPDVLLLDEPTTGLDPQARHLLWDRLYRLKQRGVTLVLTTHYMDEAEQLCDRLVVMDKARIVAEGSPRELIEQYSTREVTELRFPPGIAETLDGQLDGIAERIEHLPDRVLLYADDGEAAATAVHQRGLKPETVLVRRSSLEDVFLRLTGRSLVD